MSTVHIDASQSYDVLIGSGLLHRCGPIIKEVTGAKKAALIADDRVWELYGCEAANSLKAAGIDLCVHVIQSGEASKSIACLSELLEFLAENHLTRKDLLVALGGGVTGDLVGFAAAVYLRGVQYVQLPTTLLSAVDSSVGGKTAIDLKAGKNLAGAFKQPALVLCDTECLKTLSDSDFASGAAESIKYGVLSDPELFAHFESAKGRKGLDLNWVIARCVKNKALVVEQDEFDTGLRQTLNLGHTIGHGVEKCSGYTIPHGHAVAVGMAMIAKAAAKMGKMAQKDADRIAACLKSYGLPTETSYTPAQLAQAALGDKKRAGDSISLVIPTGIGSCVLQKEPVSRLEQIISLGVS